MNQLIGLMLLLSVCSNQTLFAQASAELPQRPVATFSIVGYDPETGDLGIAVQSKFFAVGAVVPWARAGVGAIATQSWANTTYGPKGLDLLRQGLTAEETLQKLLAEDAGREKRQVGIVDARGNTACFTGTECMAWAGCKKGTHYTAQGNILVSEKTVQAMAETFEKTPGELADRLAAALQAGQEAGGDSRGRQSAALLVVREAGGYNGLNDRYIDLRVDDHPRPIQELLRLLNLQHAYSWLNVAGDRYFNKNDVEGAIQAAQKSVELAPQNADCYYDLAEYYALANCIPEGLETLKKAVEHNPNMKTMAKNDIYLENLRQSPEFDKIVK